MPARPGRARGPETERQLSIFYVGKGKGSRWAAHEKEVHAALVRDHPRLGAALYETRRGKRVQVLQNYASGIRLIDE